MLALLWIVIAIGFTTLLKWTVTIFYMVLKVVWMYFIQNKGAAASFLLYIDIGLILTPWRQCFLDAFL
jgi:hypothetical protein